MLASWGANSHGQLGNGTRDDISVPKRCVALKGDISTRQISAGGGHTMVLGGDGSLQACGLNSHGQLGVCVPCSGCHERALSARSVASSSASNGSNGACSGGAGGADSACRTATARECTPCAADAGPVDSASKARRGGAGGGETVEEWLPVCLPASLRSRSVRHVACGWNHTLACTATGDVLAWGCNTYGQLGVSSTASQSSSHGGHDTTGPSRPCSSSCSSVKHVVPGLPAVAAVACGLRHSIALMCDGHVWTWGSNKQSQLGRGQDGKSLPADTPRQVAGLSRACAIAAGAYHNIVLVEGGRVYCWGANRHGQCGSVVAHGKSVNIPVSVELPGNVQSLVEAVSAGWSHTVALTSAGQLITWGRSTFGQLGQGAGSIEKQYSDLPAVITGIPPVKQVQCGSEHTLARTGDGKVLAWGWNEHGMCGDGTEADVPAPSVVRGLPDIVAGDGQYVARIGCGAGHSLVAFT
eukprot:scpid72473/ scgid34403/ Secretion-regulating guanine nucleotide exchange factor; Deafness locus-associated putative guanine nucleotide exchange factor; Guanine nucleotide exchange factor-related protein